MPLGRRLLIAIARHARDEFVGDDTALPV